MLAVEELSAGYGEIPVLASVSFEVGDGTLVGILGHNGMGKTTLLKALMGILPTTAGQVTFDGNDITKLPTHERTRRGLGYVPQGREIFPGLSVLDNLRFAAAAKGLNPGAAVEDILAEFPRLQPLLNRAGGALSGGEQQLLALARCLVQQPRLVLLDEPTEGIQPSIIPEIFETLSRQRRSRGLTIVLVEQNLDFIRSLSDRVLIIQKGRIVREMAPDQLADSDIVDQLIGSL